MIAFSMLVVSSGSPLTIQSWTSIGSPSTSLSRKLGVQEMHVFVINGSQSFYIIVSRYVPLNKPK